MPEPLFDTVTIVGMGLIGGSLGMALREKQVAGRVVGVARRQEAAEKAVALGAADVGSTDPASAAAEAELVVFAVPLLAIPVLAGVVAGGLSPGTIVSDVGSTKAYLESVLPPLLPARVEYVGGHPMAGSERAGIRHARPDLFAGATYVLTRPAATSAAALERVAAMVMRIGAVSLEMSAGEHDRVVARTSHLPHAAAAALAATAGAALPHGLVSSLAAGGFRDTTRVAGSPPEVWADICLTNADAILGALQDFDERLQGLRRAVSERDGPAIRAFFEAGREARARLIKDPPHDEAHAGQAGSLYDGDARCTGR
jgi:prephenate dehydrogenase